MDTSLLSLEKFLETYNFGEVKETDPEVQEDYISWLHMSGMGHIIDNSAYFLSSTITLKPRSNVGILISTILFFPKFKYYSLQNNPPTLYWSDCENTTRLETDFSTIEDREENIGIYSIPRIIYSAIN